MDVKTAYEQWLHDFAADADTIADLKAIANDPAEIEDRFYTELFLRYSGDARRTGRRHEPHEPLQRPPGNEGLGKVPAAESAGSAARRGNCV